MQIPPVSNISFGLLWYLVILPDVVLLAEVRKLPKSCEAGFNYAELQGCWKPPEASEKPFNV
jgi:hypothetical protein